MIRFYIFSFVLWIPSLFAQQAPYGGTPHSIPGIIEAEEYDLGGEGIAYHDLDTANQGGQFRLSEGVDVETCSAGGYSVGWMSTGEWIEYTVSVTKAGNYTLRIQLASALTGGTGHISFNDKDVTGIQTVPNTGGWQQWVLVEIPHIQLDSGLQVMKLTVDNAGYNISYFQFKEEIDYGELPDMPHYSAEHGFFTSPFDLTISSDSIGSVIRYTLNGSDPREDTGAIEIASPATIRIDPALTQNRTSTPAVVVRAYATINGVPVTNVGSQTYIFIDQVRNQANPGGAWPQTSFGTTPVDYEMDPDIVNSGAYNYLIDDALLQIPTICINTDIGNLFDASTGIYNHPTGRGIEWERPASVELIDPHKKEPGFQISCGLRLRGGYSRIGAQPKHAFRFFFRKEYGKGNLEYPLFGDEGVSKFDCVDLRTAQNYSWSYQGSHIAIFTRDLFSRDCQRDMGQPYTRSRQYHLYLNGMYWGLYQTQERSEASYAESYFGGDKSGYDVVKVDMNNGYSIEATDGTLDIYNQLWSASSSGFVSNEAYFKVQGRNMDGSVNINYPVLANIDNLIDYLLIIYYTGNFDAPLSAFMGNQRPNNFYGIYDRLGRNGFLFFIHDAEHTLMDQRYSENSDYGLDRTGPYFGTSIDQTYFNPQFLHEKLSKNIEYQVLFSDHIYRHFFNHGALTPLASQQRMAARSSEIDTAVIAESARWGDTKVHPARTKDDDWVPAVSWLMNSYFPTRTGVVLQQLKNDILYPSIDPPVFMSGTLEIQDNILALHAGGKVRLVNNNSSQVGSIFYTLDGTDPRAIGGSPSPSATDAGDEIELSINFNMVIKARVKNGTTWSALHEILLNTGEALSGVRITEIHYNPLAEGDISSTEFEFIELKNIGSTSLSLAGAHFVQGIEYTFPNGPVLLPNNFIVLASNAGMFQKRYGFAPTGEYNQQLDNSGERLTLVDVAGDTLFTVRYNDKAPWPDAADGSGYSIVAKNINGFGNPDSADYWRASLYIHGSPGRDDIVTGIEDASSRPPGKFQLNQNFPNPFNPTTTIGYQLMANSSVRITVCDLLGREVAVLVNQEQSAGSHSIEWDATKYSSGVYFYRLQAHEKSGGQIGSFIDTKKLVIVK
ncbi:MAG: carbohydrate-binding protein [Ignavibacteriales bacterium]|nr:carbohydrate-binding protein [Ignavibacteriales bacterium]